MGLKCIVLHKDFLYYRRSYPKNLKPAFSGKEIYRHSLKLPKNAPDSKIAAAASLIVFHNDFDQVILSDPTVFI